MKTLSPKGWINVAKPGDAFAYYHGNLMADRLAGRQSDDIDVANFFWARAGIGQVDLVQKRLGFNHFCYIAIKRTET